MDMKANRSKKMLKYPFFSLTDEEIVYEPFYLESEESLETGTVFVKYYEAK